MLRKKTVKKVVTSLGAVILMLSTIIPSGCKFLDIDPYITDMFTLDTLFTKRDYVQKYLNNVYSYMVDYGGASIGCADYGRTMPWTSISDECVAGIKRLPNHPYPVWSNNELTPETLYGFDRWDNFYTGIRKANTFIIKVNECREATSIQRLEWTGEAIFVKAALYFELMLAWGPVPIVPDTPPTFDTQLSELMPERNTWDECSDYVEGLLRRAIELLPETRIDASETGKATKNAARAILSRLTLYTASPLFNGQNGEFASFKNKAGVPYLNPVKSMEKWAKAAATAQELVELKPNDLYTVPKMSNTPDAPVPAHEKADFPAGVGGIDHYHSYKDIFDGQCLQSSMNRELLFTNQSTALTKVARFMAPGMFNGYSVFYFPQRIVNAYYMADGKDIQNSSTAYPYEQTGYTNTDYVFSGERMSDGFTLLAGTRKWYANREMRFYATVAFNNSFYASTATPSDEVFDNKTALYFSNRRSGAAGVGLIPAAGLDEIYAMTGYLCRKFIHFEDSWTPNARQKTKYGIAYRMAEVYLNYVEAMNELDGEYTVDGVTVFRNETEMKRCFNLIRYRAGLPGITDTDVANPEKMRELIERERLLEMMWEGRRYFDTRRNKTAVIYENLPVMGLDVTAKDTEPEKFYTVVDAKQERNYMYKVFTTRQTFWPIPKHVIDKNHNLTQMLGY